MQDLKQWGLDYLAQRKEYLDYVEDGTLTLEEAAQCFAGWHLKWQREEGRDECAIHPERLYRQALVDLESRLPGWKGLDATRHFGS